MYCKECGTLNDSDSRFCRNCGAALEAADPAPPTPVATASPAEESVPILPPDPVDVTALLREAANVETGGDLAGAIALAEKAVFGDPGDARARSCLAGLYERASRTEDAVAQYEAALAIDPSSRLDRLRLARLAPDREGALPASGAAKDKRPLWIAAGVAAGVFALVTAGGLIGYFAWWQPNHRIDAIETASATATSAEDAMSRARGALAVGDYLDAERWVNSALEADPTNREAQALLKTIYREQAGGGAGEALPATVASQVFASDPTAPSVGAVLGVADGLSSGLAAAMPPPGLALPEPGASAMTPEASGSLPPAGSLAPLSMAPRVDPNSEAALFNQQSAGARGATVDPGSDRGGLLENTSASGPAPDPQSASPSGTGTMRPVTRRPWARGGSSGSGFPTTPVGGSATATTPDPSQPAHATTITPAGGGAARTIQPAASTGRPTISVSSGARGSPGGARPTGESLAREALDLQRRALSAGSNEEAVKLLEQARRSAAEAGELGMPTASATVRSIDNELARRRGSG